MATAVSRRKKPLARPETKNSAEGRLPAPAFGHVVQVGDTAPKRAMAEDVRAGLDAVVPHLPSRYLYDRRGSELYEKITRLNEYYLTRTEIHILECRAREITALAERPEVVELGSGSSRKTRILLDTWNADAEKLVYYPIDISTGMLTRTVSVLNRDYGALKVMGLAGDYLDALDTLPPARKRLILFLGSSIGNLNDEEQEGFFSRLTEGMTPGNLLLLGLDYRPSDKKPCEMIVEAYNDSQGITAAFNLNILGHINRVLGGDFQPEHWRHKALYNPERHQIEMHLESARNQTVHIRELGQSWRFSAKDRILTEICRKYDPDEMIRWLEKRRLRLVGRWSDALGYFGLLLLRRT